MEMLYHYTSVETLYKIFHNVENGYIRLRANSFMNMKDPLDCRYFIKELSEILSKDNKATQEIMEKKMVEAMQNVGEPYFISLTSQRDSSLMWQLYGRRGRGISIGFSKEKLYQFVGNYQNLGDEKWKCLAKHCFCRIHNCYYWNGEDIREKFINAYNVSVNNGMELEGINENEACALSYLIKSPNFIGEEETRIIFLYSPCDCIIKNKKDSIYFPLPLESVSDIICGPCVDKETIKTFIPDSINELVKESQFSCNGFTINERNSFCGELNGDKVM